MFPLPTFPNITFESLIYITGLLSFPLLSIRRPTHSLATASVSHMRLSDIYIYMMMTAGTGSADGQPHRRSTITSILLVIMQMMTESDLWEGKATSFHGRRSEVIAAARSRRAFIPGSSVHSLMCIWMGGTAYVCVFKSDFRLHGVSRFIGQIDTRKINICVYMYI